MPKYEVHFETYVSGKQQGISVIEAENEQDAKNRYYDGDIDYFEPDLDCTDDWVVLVEELSD